MADKETIEVIAKAAADTAEAFFARAKESPLCYSEAGSIMHNMGVTLFQFAKALRAATGDGSIEEVDEK